MTKPQRMTPQRMDDGTAFFPDPQGGPALATDDLAEQMAEEFLMSATGAEDAGQETRNEMMTEELGGPFVETSAEETFASGTDASNPADAEREAFPTAMRAGEK